MKAGDIVTNKEDIGIVIRLKLDDRVPDACVILWNDGILSHHWCDHVEVLYTKTCNSVNNSV